MGSSSDMDARRGEEACPQDRFHAVELALFDGKISPLASLHLI